MYIIRYGVIGVTAAAMITGVLWFDAVRKSPRIEDIAALRAAVHERSELWTALGSYTPDFGTNVFVGVHQLWDSLYTESMSGARLLATSVWHGVDGITVMWAPEPLSNGTSIASAEVGWQCVTNAGIGGYHYTNYDWRRTAPVKLNQAGSSTACIIVRQLTDNILPGTPTQRLEVAAACYGGGTPVVDHESEIYGGTNNWWETIGVHTNVYGYGCEIWSNLSVPATVSHIGGSTWSVEPGAFRLRHNGAPTAVELVDTNVAKQYYQAAAFRMDTDMGPAYCAAYANPELGLYDIQFVEIDETPAVVTDSLTNQPAFKVRAGVMPPGEGGHFNFALSVATPGTLAGVAPSSLYFDASNWNQWQQVYVLARVDTSRVPRTGVVKVGNNDYVPVIIECDNPAPPAVELSPAMTLVPQNGGATVNASLLTNVVPTVKYDRRITSNNLDQGRQVLENLNRTWAFVPLHSSVFAATSIVTSTFGGATNLPALYNDGFYTIDDLVNAHASLSMIDYPSSWTVYDPLLFMRAQGDITLKVDLDDNTSSGAIADLALEYNALIGCSFSYPCDFAIASNLVKTVRVYAVLSCDTGEPIISLFDINTSDIVSFSADETDPDKYEDYLFDLIDGIDVRHRPANPLNMQWSQALLPITNSTITTVERVGDYDFNFVDTPVVLLATLDCSGGTRPLFDITPANLGAWPLTASDYQTQSITYNSRFWPDDEVTEIDIKFEQYIKIDFFVLEVEWNFNHFNPAVPFAPAINTPPWAAAE